MHSFEDDAGHIVIQLETGDLFLESIRSACEQHDVDTGAVLSAIGTLRHLHVHYLNTDDLSKSRDDRNTFIESEDAWEISSIDGIIADGEPHLHVTAWNGEEAVAGHLEEGNEVNALGEVLIKRLEGLKLHRTPNENGVSVLRERD